MASVEEHPLRTACLSGVGSVSNSWPDERERERVGVYMCVHVQVYVCHVWCVCMCVCVRDFDVSE